MKKEIPILFSTPMVQAILAGTKTITHQVLTPQPLVHNEVIKLPIALDAYAEQLKQWQKKRYTHVFTEGALSGMIGPKCKWEAGNILWVRESFSWDWKDYPQRTEKYYYYKADTPTDFLTSGEKWKPSIHMPKDACRIYLEVTRVKVERLQNITEEDARAEGVANGNLFRSLWQQINGNWEANPWVWVIEYKILSTTGKPTQNPKLKTQN